MIFCVAIVSNKFIWKMLFYFIVQQIHLNNNVLLWNKFIWTKIIFCNLILDEYQFHSDQLCCYISLIACCHYSSTSFISLSTIQKFTVHTRMLTKNLWKMEHNVRTALIVVTWFLLFSENLNPDESCRRAVSAPVWNILKKYFPSAPEFPFNSPVCMHCEVTHSSVYT